MTRHIEERFWSKVDQRGPNDCWPWLGARHERGYGRFILGERNRRANRVAWEIANARPVPDGMLVCHSCDNPPCVNPAHLWIGTLADNARDMVAKGRHANPQKTHCPHGHEYSPENTRVSKAGSRNCRLCHRRRNRRANWRTGQ